jgi:hypothetical protein
MRFFELIAIATLLAVFSFSILSTTAHAQLGEVAGEPTFYVNISGTYSYNYTFINQGSTPIPFKTIITNFRTAAKNATAPIMTASPMSGTIPPNSQIKVRVNVYLPSKNNTPGMEWQGVLEVVVNSTSSSTGGAVIDEGVAKVVTIVATAPKPNYTAEILIILAIAVIVIVVAAFAYMKRSRKTAKGKSQISGAKARATVKKPSSVGRKKASKSKAVKKGRPRKASKSRKKGTRRKRKNSSNRR